MSTSTADDGARQDALAGEEMPAWPALPTETEIYLLPDGQVIIADLPAELAHLVTRLAAIAPTDNPDPSPSYPSDCP